MAEFYINPYSNVAGVSVDTDEVYNKDGLNDLLEKKIAGKFEEYSVDLVDGTSAEVNMWQNISFQSGADYSGLALFVEAMNEDEYLHPGIAFAFEYGAATDDVSDAVTYAENGSVSEGTLKDLAYAFVDEGIIDLDNTYYFDYDAFAFALDANGDLPEEAYDQDTGEQLWDDQEVKDYAEQLVDDVGPSNISGDFIDYDAVARDLGFDYDQFTYGGDTYTIFTSQ
jgi:hypothetical protein